MTTEEQAKRAAQFIETLKLRGMRNLYEARAVPPPPKVLPAPKETV